MPRPTIVPVPCLRDNYAYLIVSGTDALIVDPSEEGPPADALRTRGLTLRGIVLTHHHPDHVGGIEGLLDAAPQGHGIWVAGHASDEGRIPRQTLFVDAPRGRYVQTDVSFGGLQFDAMHIPGHTTGAIAWRIPAHEGPADVFTGDTLFAAGCGRLFEGTPADMHQSLQSICDEEPETRLWFGHEYTAANLRFAASVEPDNGEVTRRAAALGTCTTPTTVAEERATNPFVRVDSVDELAARRTAKDGFRG